MPGTIADADSVLIDGKAFTVTPGKAKVDTSSLIQSLGARDLGPGAIVFRSGDKLYIVDTPLLAGVDRGRNVYVTAEQAQPNRVKIEYGVPKSAEFQQTYDLLKKAHALETMQQILSPFVLPEDLLISARECGMVNAWYVRENNKPTVVICYDMLQQVLQSLPKEKTSAGITPLDATLGQFFWLVTHKPDTPCSIFSACR